MLAWGIVIGIIVIEYIFPILDYIILFKIGVEKAIIQIRLNNENKDNNKRDTESHNAIGFRYDKQETEDYEKDEEYNFSSLKRKNKA